MSRRAPVSVLPLLGFCALLTAPLACQKRDEGAGKPAPVPPLDPGSAQAAPAPPPAPAAPAAPAAEPAPAAAAATGGSITGKIVLSGAVAKAKPQGTLYLVARRISDNPNARGTLIAVKKLPATSFPLPFSLSAADMPFQNGPFDGELTITARIDQDGDPMSHQKGDVFGSLPKVAVGSRDVKLVLDQVQKETESLAGGGGPMMGQPGGGMPPGHP
ncbi:MAG TPA: hypothetical protein VHM31_13195 [Polyangia bacterium]|nr:hypothetical protein [Polyangia bacterium]